MRNDFQQTICISETVDEEQHDSAQELRLNAINGIAIALRHLEKYKEALDLLHRELKQKKLSRKNEIQLTINYCNTLVIYHRDFIKESDAVYNEVQSKLNSLSSRYRFNHEEQGILYCSYGALYTATSKPQIARTYYQKAKKEFIIINSPHIEQAEQALKILENV